MSRSSPSQDAPEWVRLSVAFLAFLGGEGEGAYAELAAHLERLITAGAETELPSTPESLGDDPDFDGLGRDAFWMAVAHRRFPDLADYDDPIVDVSFGDNDLAEIAVELERALSFRELGRADDALWEWKFAFDCHWRESHAEPLLRYARSRVEA